MTALVEEFGNIDIYLFDQLLRGNISPGMRVVDAGCGGWAEPGVFAAAGV